MCAFCESLYAAAEKKVRASMDEQHAQVSELQIQRMTDDAIAGFAELLFRKAKLIP